MKQGASRMFLAFALSAFAIANVPALPAFGSSSRPDVTDPVQIVRSVMATPDDKIDFAEAKLTLDKLYDPTIDVKASLKQVDEMEQTIRKMAGPSAPPKLLLIMLHKYIYEAGAWNDSRPFQYDLTDPLGKKPANRLLSTYLRTRRGNCVSMPILFVALAQRLGLKATLSTAPNHMFVKYTDDVTGRTINLETTSGAYPARDVYIRQTMPMTDEAIANGIYMKTLSKKEALAVMADIAIEHAFATGQYQQGWDIANVISPYYPNNLSALLAPTNAALGLIQIEFLSKYPAKADIPPQFVDRFNFLEKTIPGALNNAYALGWRETDGETQPAAVPPPTEPH
jgi:regulator of sirC expression with transglutaminase-like and TPR domain